MKQIKYEELITFRPGTIFLQMTEDSMHLCRLERPNANQGVQFSFVGPYYVSAGIDARPYEHVCINTEPCMLTKDLDARYIALSPRDGVRIARQLAGMIVGDGDGVGTMDNEEARGLVIDFGDHPHAEKGSIAKL